MDGVSRMDDVEVRVATREDTVMARILAESGPLSGAEVQWPKGVLRLVKRDYPAMRLEGVTLFFVGETCRLAEVAESIRRALVVTQRRLRGERPVAKRSKDGAWNIRPGNVSVQWCRIDGSGAWRMSEGPELADVPPAGAQQWAVQRVAQVLAEDEFQPLLAMCFSFPRSGSSMWFGPAFSVSVLYTQQRVHIVVWEMTGKDMGFSVVVDHTGKAMMSRVGRKEPLYRETTPGKVKTELRKIFRARLASYTSGTPAVDVVWALPV